jgi:CheY-like chemotaxis protein
MEDSAMPCDNALHHVLVIDDDQSNIELFREILEDEQHQVSVATSPAMGPAEILALAPDLILLDLRFRETTGGFALLQRLKADSRCRRIPVLVCSGDHQQLSELHDQLVAWNCGMVAKPFDLTELLQAIQACLIAAAGCRIGSSENGTFSY